MKRRDSLSVTTWRGAAGVLAMALLPACGPSAPPPPTGPGGAVDADPACNYTAASDAHVQPRHCDPNQFKDKSKFNGATTACQGIAGGQSFCSTVQGSPTSRKIQPDGRICYDKDFQKVIGTQNGTNQSWGRVVIDQNTGVVVSQFPESGAGCP